MFLIAFRDVGVRPELMTNVGCLIRRPEDNDTLRVMYSMWGTS